MFDHLIELRTQLIKTICTCFQNYIEVVGDAKEKYEYNKLLGEMQDLIRAKDKGGKAFEKKFNEMQKIANEEEKKDKAKNIKIKKQKNFKSFRKLLRGKREVSDIKYFKSLDVDK